MLRRRNLVFHSFGLLNTVLSTATRDQNRRSVNRYTGGPATSVGGPIRAKRSIRYCIRPGSDSYVPYFRREISPHSHAVACMLQGIILACNATLKKH
ncbi:hypothetical protein EV127DRAFT_435517 [Xylaria flabelliformis]|nr:hypothetical protein EV127DRAFT_435517 [Xylaria flabelliformis]